MSVPCRDKRTPAGRRPFGANLIAQMAKRRIKQRKRLPRGRFLLRWLILAVFGFVAFLYSNHCELPRPRDDALEQRAQKWSSLRAQKRSLERRLAEADTPEALTREARRLGYVKPGERLFIVKGIDAWRRAQARRPALARPPLRSAAPWTTAQLVERQLGRRHAHSSASSSAARSARLPSPSSPPTTSPAIRSRRRTTSPARTSSPPSRGSRRRAESSAGASRVASDRLSPRAWQRATRRAARRVRSRARRRRDRPGRRSVARARHRRLAEPEQLKCLHAHAAFALARPGYELGERILAEIDSTLAWNLLHERRGVAVMSAPRGAISSRGRARSAAVGGGSPQARVPRGRPCRSTCSCTPRSTRSLDELRKRVGQTFTLEQLTPFTLTPSAGAETQLSPVPPRRPGPRPVDSSRTLPSTFTPAAQSTTRLEDGQRRTGSGAGRRSARGVSRSRLRSSCSRSAWRSVRRSRITRRGGETSTSDLHAGARDFAR